MEEYFQRRGTRKRTSFNQHQMMQRVLSIFTTRGCPYRCTYCHNLFGKKLRKRSVRKRHRRNAADEGQIRRRGGRDHR